MTTIQINTRGTLTLPQAIRKALGLERGGVVMADVEHGSVVLRPAVAYPIEIYSPERIAEFDAADAELRRQMNKRPAKRR